MIFSRCLTTGPQLLALLLLASPAIAQVTEPTPVSEPNLQLDSLYIAETQDLPGPDKVLHAEPLFIDLIRDLGARKGEREWNVGVGLTDNFAYDSNELLVEYEWAPLNRLGLEVEVPVTFYSGRQNDVQRPKHRLNGLKTAFQYSFYVSEKNQTSMAFGYINEVLFNNFNALGRKLVTGNGYSPFLVAARRWGSNIHSLIYTGPIWEQEYGREGHTEFSYQFNTSFHYMIPGTRNFVGLETNKMWRRHDFDLTFRPQMRVSLADNLMVGIVGGIPIRRENERLSSFLRLIYEPGHHHK
jgi:hypothetical protein